MLPEEALNALTLNGAAAIELGHLAGSITPSKSASLIITKPVTSLDYLPYTFGASWIEKVIISGKLI